MNKRAITPLMATFLLISLAIALGVVIMNFGRAEVQKRVECSVENLGLAFVDIEGVKQVCMDKNTQILEMVIENGGVMDIAGLNIDLIGEEKTATFTILDSALKQSSSAIKKINLSEVGPPRRVKLIPQLEFSGDILTCPEQAVEASSIPDCAE